MSNVRLRRLQADFEKLSDYVKRHPRLKIIQSDGEPPERYQLEFRIRSLRQKDTELIEAKSHLVEIHLPRNYPRVPPQCRMLTPVFHPNIAPHAICVGDHWNAGEPLASLVARIGEMLAFQSYNVKSPLNGEAARWVEQHLDELPLDPVSLLIEEPALRSHSVASATPATARKPATAEPRLNRKTDSELDSATKDASKLINVSCPGCQTNYRMPFRPGVHRARCPKCQTVFELPSEA